MKKILLFAFLVTSLLVRAQNLPACDSLVINCCSFDSAGPNTITIYADNHSSDIFDYPGFVLLNLNMDTIAKETVTYFGIGTGFQPHTLDIVSTLHLPFTGYLELYKGFFTEFACRFPFYIPDSANSVSNLQGEKAIEIFPNPAGEFITIISRSENQVKISIYNMLGSVAVQPKQYDRGAEYKIDIHTMPAGIYWIEISSDEKNYQLKLVKQ